jgi:hypothetical protein
VCFSLQHTQTQRKATPTAPRMSNRPRRRKAAARAISRGYPCGPLHIWARQLCATDVHECRFRCLCRCELVEVKGTVAFGCGGRGSLVRVASGTARGSKTSPTCSGWGCLKGALLPAVGGGSSRGAKGRRGRNGREAVALPSAVMSVSASARTRRIRSKRLQAPRLKDQRAKPLAYEREGRTRYRRTSYGN